MAAWEIKEGAGDRGRGLFAAAQIHAGDVVLQELPILLYPQLDGVCHHCLRLLDGCPHVACQRCHKARFCSAACAAAADADAGSHNELVCRSLGTCNLSGLSDEQQAAVQFLARACSLRTAGGAGDAAAAARYAALWSLAGTAQQAGVVEQELHGRLSHAFAAAGAALGATPLEVACLLRKDEVNGYAIMAPSGPEGERRVRGAGLYPHASLLNHDCLPNVVRFDRFDAPAAGPPGSNAAMEFRSLHDLPPGEELTQSYFPLGWSYRDRQERCAEQYGFECCCERCKEESTWPASSDDEASMGDADEAPAGSPPGGEGDEEELPGGSGAELEGPAHEGGADPAYIGIFLLKYVCPREGCGGTLAPLPGAPDRFECAMCGGQRSEAEFLAELESVE